MTDSPRHVFVYGTLKPGQSRWAVLAPFQARGRPPLEDVVAGQLWDTTCGWPAMTIEPANEVAGVVVALEPARTEAALFELDAIEGVDVGRFRRVLVTTRAARPAWTYVWGGSVTGLRRLGRTWPPPSMATRTSRASGGAAEL